MPTRHVPLFELDWWKHFRDKVEAWDGLPSQDVWGNESRERLEKILSASRLIRTELPNVTGHAWSIWTNDWRGVERTWLRENLTAAADRLGQQKLPAWKTLTRIVNIFSNAHLLLLQEPVRNLWSLTRSSSMIDFLGDENGNFNAAMDAVLVLCVVVDNKQLPWEKAWETKQTVSMWTDDFDDQGRNNMIAAFGWTDVTFRRALSSHPTSDEQLTPAQMVARLKEDLTTFTCILHTQKVRYWAHSLKTQSARADLSAVATALGGLQHRTDARGVTLWNSKLTTAQREQICVLLHDSMHHLQKIQDEVSDDDRRKGLAVSCLFTESNNSRNKRADRKSFTQDETAHELLVKLREQLQLARLDFHGAGHPFAAAGTVFTVLGTALNELGVWHPSRRNNQLTPAVLRI